MIHYAIPSKGRPMTVKSAKYLPAASVYVPEQEADVYARCGVKNLIPVPSTVRGITATRNWILDHVEAPWVVMVDDDVQVVGWLEMGETTATVMPMSTAEIMRECDRLADLTDDLGYRVFGPATLSARRAVYPYRPFLWRSYVLASCIGIANHRGVRFDPAFKVKEDYELCLRCLVEDGGVVAARYWFWQNDHWTAEGGCATDRTRAVEEDAIRMLRQKYPGMVKQVKRGGSMYSVELTV